MGAGVPFTLRGSATSIIILEHVCGFTSNWLRGSCNVSILRSTWYSPNRCLTGIPIAFYTVSQLISSRLWLLDGLALLQCFHCSSSTMGPSYHIAHGLCVLPKLAIYMYDYRVCVTMCRIYGIGILAKPLLTCR